MPPELNEGELLVRATHISVDPYMRGKMDDTAGQKTYFAGSFDIGRPMSGTVGGVVMASRADGIREGDTVKGFLPWQRFVNAKASELSLIDTHDSKVPLEKWMSSAAYSGISSYLPILKIAEPKTGEVAFVSGAAGAVGSVACQVLLKMGCTVIGSAGTQEKVEWLRQLGIAAFNYKTDKTQEMLATHAPDGIDIYFDNVGGEVLEAVLEHMNNFGRIVACGMISQYDKPPEARYGVRNLFHIVGRRLKMQGFIMSDYSAEERASAQETLCQWISNGDIKTTETILDGFDKVPDAFIGLFSGQNTGKMLVRCE